MKYTRYEIETKRLKSGRLLITVYDEYWDTCYSATLESVTGSFQDNRLDAQRNSERIRGIFASIPSELSNLQPDCWYAIRTPNHPLDAPTEMVRIPGRNRIYVQR